jgi:hypothetical protein
MSATHEINNIIPSMYVTLASNPFSYYGAVSSRQGVMCLNAVCCYLLKQRREEGAADKHD